MNPYVVSVSGAWPDERYVYNINSSVIDYRFNQMPVKFICSPYYSEDHDFTELSYSPPSVNLLVGLSSNSKFFVTQNNLEFNVGVTPNLTFSWSPSALRKENRGNSFGTLMLNSEAPTFYGASVYPSQLFLYPLSSFVQNYYQRLTSNVISLTGYDIVDVSAIVDLVTAIPSLNNYTITNLLPFSSVSYNTSAWYSSAFNAQSSLNVFLNDIFSFGLLISSVTINNSLTSINYNLASNFYYTCSFLYTQQQINSFILQNPNIYDYTIFLEQPSAVNYSTLIYAVSSQSFVLQTSTVLLKPYQYQFVDWNYGKIIKQEHNSFLSNKKLLSSTNYYGNDIQLDNVMYELSGAITYGRRPILRFYDNLNPIYYQTVLDPEYSIIRPDTVKLGYSIEFYDYIFQQEPRIRNLGETYDDLNLFPDTHLGSSYILKRDNASKTLTFQLLQSSVNTQLPLEDASNCVLSAILNYDTSRFEYFNTAKYVYTPDTFGVITPVSGVRDSILSLRYMAETPYIFATTESISSTLLSISSNTNISLNTPINWTNHKRQVNWNLKYPPYYYSFKNSYKKTPYYNYENKNSLNFYLSSVLIDEQIKNIDSSDVVYSEINLYNSIYSDFDILELPLKTYGKYDLINFRIENLADTLDTAFLSAFLVNGNTTTFYDITASPYVPAVSGTYLRLLYNLSEGGTHISLRPSLSTLCGPLEAYWATTFPVAWGYQATNYIQPLKIETLNQDLSSITLSVKNLSGGKNSGLDLTNTYLSWSYTSKDILNINNLTTTDPSLQTISPTAAYLFEDANTIKITGITNQTLAIFLSSQKYNTVASVSADPDYFDLYSQNVINIQEIYSNKKTKIKQLGFSAKVPYFSKILNLPGSCAVSWTWEYDNITDSKSIPVSAYKNSLFSVPYKYGSIVDLQDNIYFLIESDYTTTEIFKSFKLNVEVYDQGKIINGQIDYPVNSYPDSTIVSTDFTVVYDKFPSVDLISTSNSKKSLTRPPNGTNTFKFIPQKLQTTNVYISALQWQIDSRIIYENTTLSDVVSSIVIPLSTNVIGDYNTSLTKSFNLYNRVYNTYYNLEYLNGNKTQSIVSFEELNNILTNLSPSALALNNSYLSYLSSSVNLVSAATSLYVVSTSKYISTFDTPNSLEFLQDYSNLYSVYYYTSTVSALSSGLLLYTYNNYMVDFWLSSSNILISDQYSLIKSFSATNITNNQNLLYNTTRFNLTTSLSYGISSDRVRTNLYYYNTVYLKANNVVIPGWKELYDFQKSADLIITNQAEFSTSPIINIMPRFSWVPENNKKTNRFLQILDVQNNYSSYYNALSGKTYLNKIDRSQEYDLIIKNVQDKNITANDSLVFVFSLGDESPLLLADQIIDSTLEYTVSASAPKDVIIKNFKLPYHSDLYQSTGGNLYLTAFNRFFPVEGGITYLGVDSLTSRELTLRTYPITAVTQSRIYNSGGNLLNNLLEMSPRLFDYEPCKLLFYPKLNIINLDDGGLIQVKQILETNPPNSPNIINYDLSTVTYILSSDYWISYTTLPAVSSATINLFNITIGNALIPLQVSDYNISNLVLSASARIATQIPSTTFDKTSGYSGEKDLWEIVYQDVIGNEENTYKFLNFKISTGTTNVTSYPIETENKWILVI